MKNLTGTVILLAVFLAALPGCCGFMQDAGDYEVDEREEREEPLTRSTGFEGTFEVVNEEYDDLSLKISKNDSYYELGWGVPATERWFAYGVRIGDYLGAYMTEGEDVVVGIYERDGEGISGIWDIYGEFVYDMTEDAEELELSSYDFSGTYLMESPDPETDEIHYYDLVIEEAGDLYSVKEVYEGGYELTGSGLAVDDVIVMGFPVGGTAVAKFYRLRGSRLNGKHFYSYYDDETGLTEVEVSEEKGKRN